MPVSLSSHILLSGLRPRIEQAIKQMARSGKTAVEVIAMKETASKGRTPRAGWAARPKAKRPRELPIVRIRGRPYYQDDRLQEFRPMDAPWERIGFEEMAWIIAVLGKWPD